MKTQVRTVLIGLIISFGLLSCKKEKGELKVLQTKYYPVEYTMEMNDNPLKAEIDYHSNNLIKRIKATGNEKYSLEYGVTNKLEKIVFEDEKGVLLEQKFLYSSTGNIIEIETYERPKSISNKETGLCQTMKKQYGSMALVRENSSENNLENAGDLLLLMRQKLWLNNELLPEKIEEIAFNNTKMGESIYEYDENGNIEKESHYVVDLNTSELKFTRSMTHKFDDKKSPASDLQNNLRFTFLGAYYPFLKHVINNPTETTISFDSQEAIKTKRENEYTGNGYLEKNEFTVNDGTKDKEGKESFDYKAKTAEN